MKLQRTAGPLGDWFGFYFESHGFSFSINAGWYVVFLSLRGVGFFNVALRPLQFMFYSSRWSK